LLAEDFGAAKSRLEYANDLLDGRDLEAQARLAVVLGLQGKIPEAENLLRDIKKAEPPQLPPDAGPDLSTTEGKILSIMLPFLDEPRLAFSSQGMKFGELMERVFGSLDR
jgi:hypothetical protein